MLELIQNADDNKYGGGANGRSPTIRFTLLKDFVVVSNNELGFEEVSTVFLNAHSYTLKHWKPVM